MTMIGFPEVPSATSIALVKAGQVGPALLENLIAETPGAIALIEEAKISSECNPDLGNLPEDSPPLKTMNGVFMEQAELPDVKGYFDSVRMPQQGSNVDTREIIVIDDGLSLVNGKLGGFRLPAGTANQLTGMVNAKPMYLTYRYNRGAETQFEYDVTGCFFIFKTAGLVNFIGNFNFAMLPDNFELHPEVERIYQNTSPVPYQNPTFIGERGKNECPYRMTLLQKEVETSPLAAPNIYRSEVLFEGKFTHYDVAKNTEHRHGFNVTIRVKAGDRVTFMMERGRSIASYTGQVDVIRTVALLNKTVDGTTEYENGENQIVAIYMTD